MAGSSESSLGEKPSGLPVFHAGDKTGKRQLAAPCQASAWSRMVWSLHCPRSRGRSPAATHSRSFLQSGICHQLYLVAPDRCLGCCAVRRVRSPGAGRSGRSARNHICSGPSPSPPLCLRTESSADRTRRFEIRPIARDLAGSPRRRSHPEDGRMLSGGVSEEEIVRHRRHPERKEETQ
jgi:hypothetical protein